jgi:hypothetical protein
MSIINNENNEEITKIFSKSLYKKTELISNLNEHNNICEISLLNLDTLDKNSDNIESFRKFYLFQTKKFFDGTTYFGLVHIRLAFFVKNKTKYKKYITTLINKIDNAIKISDEHNEIKGKFYVYLDLENANPKNFSRKFLKEVVKVVEKLYVNQLVHYFISGKKLLIKKFWPIIALFLDKKTKKKIICLK